MPYVITWLTENPGRIVTVIVIVYWVVSAIKSASKPASPAVRPTPKAPEDPQALAGPQPQRLPYQPQAGQPPTGTPLAGSPAPQTQTFADQAVNRLQQRFASNLGRPTNPVSTSQSSQSMDALRAESDRRYTADAATTTAQQVVTDATAAAKAANKPGLVEILGGGDSRKGTLVAALVLSQALDRRRSGQRRGGSKGTRR